MKPEVLAALPQLRRDYLRRADPQTAAMHRYFKQPEPVRQRQSVASEQARQRRAETKTQRDFEVVAEQDNTPPQARSEDQGDGERSGDGGGSAMVKNQAPQAKLRPPEHIARPVDESAFRKAWLAEQRSAAMRLAARHQGESSDAPSRRCGPEPER